MAERKINSQQIFCAECRTENKASELMLYKNKWFCKFCYSEKTIKPQIRKKTFKQGKACNWEKNV